MPRSRTTGLVLAALTTALALVEIIAGQHSSVAALVQAHAFARKIGKTPIMLADGAVGRAEEAGAVSPADRG